jgi:hypothetical protein
LAFGPKTYQKTSEKQRFSVARPSQTASKAGKNPKNSRF